jgi:hypothetical protein
VELAYFKITYVLFIIPGIGDYVKLSGIKTVDKKMDSAADEKVIIDINEPELNENTVQSTIDLQMEDETGGDLEIRQEEETGKQDSDEDKTHNEELELADAEEDDELEIKTEDIQEKPEKTLVKAEDAEPLLEPSVVEPEIVEPIAKAEVVEPSAKAEVVEPVTNAEVVEPVTNAEVVEPIVVKAEVVEPSVVKAEVVEPSVVKAEVVEPSVVKAEDEKAPVKQEESPMQEDTLPVKTIINELNPVEEPVYTNKQAKTRRPRRSRALTMKDSYAAPRPTVQKNVRRTQRCNSQNPVTDNLNRKSRFRKRSENLISLK